MRKNFAAKKFAGVLRKTWIEFFLNTLWAKLGGRTMWWILLILTVDGLTADTVHRTLKDCESRAREYAVARCVAVEIRFPEGVSVE